MLNAVRIQLVEVVNGEELIRQLGRQSTGQGFTHGHNRNRVDNLKQLGDFRCRRQGQNFSRQRRVDLLIQQDRAECIRNVDGQRQWLALLMTVHVELDVGCQQTLRSIPAGEVIARVTHQEGQLLIAPLVLQLDRRGEFAQQRRHRLEVDVIKHEGLLGLSHVQHVMYRMTAFLQRDHLAFVVIQLDGERNMQRVLLFLLSRRRCALADGQGVLLGFRVVVVFDGHNRRTGLAVPAAEMGQIDIRGIFHRLYEIVAGGSAAVVALEIELHPFLEIRFTQQSVDHADDFRTFLIHRQGVEVVHLDHFIRADRVRHRAGIFRKLQAAHGAHVIDAVYCARAEVRAELLIAEDG